MLSKEDNELLTRVGSGTPMGELLRRFWMPGFFESEVAEPDSAPIRLRLLGEDLVAFKDSDGRIGVLDAHCPHRLAHLYFGRNEECGLRCVYHGWKFDVDGNCLDMPSEPADSNFKDKVRQTAYPTAVRNSVVWVYMGPREKMPELPAFEWSLLPVEQIAVTKRLQECSWAQAVEGGIDSAHISFLHRDTMDSATAGVGSARVVFGQQTNPVFDVQPGDAGLMIGARRIADDGRYLWRVHQYLVPFYNMIPPGLRDGDDSSGAPYSGHAWVPIDDENTWTWTFACNPHRPMTEEEKGVYARDHLFRGRLDENYHPLSNRANDYSLDRALQRTSSFSGIPGLGNQDAAMQESMGRIVDRSKERLGTSDAGVIGFRKTILAMACDLQNGIEPAAAQHGDWYNVRSVSAVLDPGVSYLDGAGHLFAAGGLKTAAE